MATVVARARGHAAGYPLGRGRDAARWLHRAHAIWQHLLLQLAFTLREEAQPSGVAPSTSTSLTLTRILRTTSQDTPAMAAGIADHVCTCEEIAALLD